jgi:tRNA-2-methylthio-N6-dimethylallyladenosine synthase
VGEIEEEARRLVGDGALEITLLAQTIDTYGRDLGPGAPRLAQLLATLHRIEGLKRIRFLTSHPAECREDLWRTMHDLGDKVMPFIHIPAQSGSDRILGLMARGYSRRDYLAAANAARRLCPEIELSSDWIVGFPGEGEVDFRESIGLLEEVRFQSGYFFKYSRREGTPAASLADDVGVEEKIGRHRLISAAQERIALEKNRERIGKIEEVLIQGPSKTDPARQTGRSRTFRLVHLPGGPQDHGRIVQVKITGATALCLMGERSGP